MTGWLCVKTKCVRWTCDEMVNNNEPQVVQHRQKVGLDIKPCCLLTSHCAPGRPDGISPAGTSPHRLWIHTYSKPISYIYTYKFHQMTDFYVLIWSTWDITEQYVNVCVCLLPPDSATLLVVDLDELAEAAGVVVVGRLGIPKGLMRKWKESMYHHGDRWWLADMSALMLGKLFGGLMDV